MELGRREEEGGRRRGGGRRWEGHHMGLSSPSERVLEVSGGGKGARRRAHFVSYAHCKLFLNPVAALSAEQ